MSALATEAAVTCPCGSDHLCGCGCGEVLANVDRAHALVAAGATHKQAAQIMGVCREYVSVLHRKPPRFLVGHFRLSREQYDKQLETNRDQRESRQRSLEESCLRHAREKAARGDVGWAAHADNLTSRVVRERDPELWMRLQSDRWIRKALAEQKAELAAITRARRRASRRSRRREFKFVRLDNPLGSETVGSKMAAPIEQSDCLSHVRRNEIWEIVGDTDPDYCDEQELARLRGALLNAGISPPSVQQAERERLREPDPHTARQKAPLIPGKKKRLQKIAHKQANRNSGNSNRPSQKPRKRWTRDQAGAA